MMLKVLDQWFSTQVHVPSFCPKASMGSVPSAQDTLFHPHHINQVSAQMLPAQRDLPPFFFFFFLPDLKLPPSSLHTVMIYFLLTCCLSPFRNVNTMRAASDFVFSLLYPRGLKQCLAHSELWLRLPVST